MGIIYAQRDALGRISGTYANPQPGYAEEAVDEESAEVQAFLNPPDLSIYRRAEVARQERRFRARLRIDPVGALVERAKSDATP